MNIGAATLPGKIGREGGNGLQLPEGTLFSFVGEGCKGGVDLINHISILAAGVEIKVTRAGSGMDSRPRWGVGDEFPLGRVQPVDQQLIDTQVGGNSVTIIRGQVN